MDLRLTEEQQQLQAALRRLFDRRLSALVEALPEPPTHDAPTDLADAQALGLTGLGLPEEFGGAGTFTDLVVAHEEIGRGLGGPVFADLAAAGRFLVHSTGQNRGELLRALAAGEWTPTTEPPVELDDAARRLARSEIAVLAAARQLGGGRAVLERTIEHVKTREQFDRAIGTFQAVQHQLADVATDLDAVGLAVAQAAWAVDAALAPDERCRLADIAALAAATAFRRATLVAHQLHGGMGFVLDSPLHLWSTRAIDDRTVPMSRRDVLDDLAMASGVTADTIAAPPEHRLTQH